MEWVAIFFSRGSSWSRDQTHVSWIIGHISCIAGNFFVAEPLEKPMSYIYYALWIICLNLPLSYVLFLSHQGSPKYCICAVRFYQFYLIKLIMILRSKKKPFKYEYFSILKFSSKENQSRPAAAAAVASVVSDSVRPHRRQPTRLPRPWDSPGKNTGVGCHFLLQCMKVKNESEVAQSCPTLRDHMDCSLPGSSVHGIFRARVLEGGTVAFSAI